MSNYLRIYFLATFCLLFSLTSVQSQTLCENGEAAGYPCENIDLLSNVTLSEMGCNGGNDIWGWTDTTTGKEYE